MQYSRVQFITKVISSKRPWTAIGEAEDPFFILEDDGPGHVSALAVGAPVMRIPWSNIAAADVKAAPVAKPLDVARGISVRQDDYSQILKQEFPVAAALPRKTLLRGKVK